MATTLFSDNFDSQTVGSLPAGWTTANGSTWAVATDGPTSGANDLRSTTAKQFDTILRTGTAEVAQDTQRYSFKYDGTSAHCLAPIWRSDSTFNNAYVSNFNFVNGTFLYFKRLSGSYGSQTSYTYPTITKTTGDTVSVERTMLASGAVEFRVWNATTTMRPSSAGVTIPADTSSPLPLGYSGIFSAGDGSQGFDDYSYADNSSAAASTISVDRLSSLIYFSPYNWDDDGTSHNSGCTGAYLKTVFSGTSLAINTVALSGLTNYPILRVFVDNLPYTDVAIQSGVTSYTLASGLASGSHKVKVILNRMDDSSGGRDTGTNALKIKSLVIDSGAALSAPTLRSKTMIWYGDSISEGLRSRSATSYTGDDSTATEAALIAKALDAEVGVVAYGGQAYAQAGTASVPGFNSFYNLNFTGRSRLVSGVLFPAPDYLVNMLGTNPIGTYATQADVTTALTNQRTIAPGARIFQCVPPGGYSRSAITAAVAAAVAAGDTKLNVVDLGTNEQVGLDLNGYSLGTATVTAFEGVHPTADANAQLAARRTAIIQGLLGGTAVQRLFRQMS